VREVYDLTIHRPAGAGVRETNALIKLAVERGVPHAGRVGVRRRSRRGAP
jgi:hypothetical protein